MMRDSTRIYLFIAVVHRILHATRHRDRYVVSCDPERLVREMRYRELVT